MYSLSIDDYDDDDDVVRCTFKSNGELCVLWLDGRQEDNETLCLFD